MAPMLRLPQVLVARYRPATEREVHSRSFGQLKAPRNPDATGWEQRRGTLEDQAIFGPQRDFECASGTYRRPKYRNIFCHRCFVKVTTSSARRRNQRSRKLQTDAVSKDRGWSSRSGRAYLGLVAWVAAMD